MIFNTGTGVVEPRHVKSRIESKIRVTTEIIASLSASKNPCFQQCYFVEILWLKNLCQFTQSCFLNSFQLVFYTSLTLRRCNTLSLLTTPLLQNPHYLMYFLYSSQLCIACLLNLVQCTTPYSNFISKEIACISALMHCSDFVFIINTICKWKIALGTSLEAAIEKYSARVGLRFPAISKMELFVTIQDCHKELHLRCCRGP